MDADRFDALSRALTTAGSRRATLGALLGALLGGALPVLTPDALAGKGKGKTKRGGDAAKKERQPDRGAGATGEQKHARQKRDDARTRDVTDEQTRQRAEATESEGGEVRAGEVSVASHCLPPGAKPCREGSECCSGRCKRRRRKCRGCPKGSEYCASQEACVAPGTCVTSCATGTADCDGNGTCETNTTNSAQHCGGCNKPCGSNQTCVNSVCTGDSGTCTTNSDCCPADRPGCASETGNLYKTCSNGDCVCAHPDYPHACVWPPNPSQCHQCCSSDDCIVKTGDPNRVCLNGNCVCDGDKPKLCSVRVEGGKTYCTDPRSDPENCSPFIEDCGTKCAPDWDCINGTCTFPG